MRKLPALMILAIITSALAACAAPQPHAKSVLAGTEWHFVTIDGQAPVSNKARLGFTEDGISASVGCNSMGGNWHLSDGRLIAGPMVQTEMYCEGPVWPQEQALNALLVAAPEVSLGDARLLLKSSGHSAELERVALPAAAHAD